MRIDILLIAAMAATAVAAPVAAQDKPAVEAQAQMDPAAQLICKRVEETGSLVKKKKKNLPHPRRMGQARDDVARRHGARPDERQQPR